jgi:hypothetical protein
MNINTEEDYQSDDYMEISIDGDDYTFVEGQDQEQWTIRLKTGEFKDTFYQYGKIKVHESKNEDPILKFSYKILEADGDIDSISADRNFLDHISAVLKHILEDSLLNDTNNNTEELNPE